MEVNLGPGVQGNVALICFDLWTTDLEGDWTRRRVDITVIKYNLYSLLHLESFKK